MIPRVTYTPILPAAKSVKSVCVCVGGGGYIHCMGGTCMKLSLVPRPIPVFQCCTLKNGMVWYATSRERVLHHRVLTTHIVAHNSAVHRASHEDNGYLAEVKLVT